jgi:hypothetical protein
MMTDKTTFVSAFRTASKKVEIPDFDGAEVYVRKLSALERVHLADNAGDDKVSERIAATIGYVIAHGVTDQAGNRLFSDEDADTVAGQIPADAADVIVKAILEYSGLGAGDAEKN